MVQTSPEAVADPARPGAPQDAFWVLPAAEAVALLGSDAARGLGGAEVASRRVRFGPNALPDPPPPSRLALVGRQFRSALVLLLVAAAAVSLALGEWIDAAVVAAIVVLNAALGAVQESRAETAARAVRTLLSPRAVVVRDGSAQRIDAAELVPGDIVLVGAGDRVPADGRLVEASRLEVDESAMTGESAPVAKRVEPPAPADAILAERPTVLLSGTTVTRGRGRLLVTATGESTELARIASAARRPTPTTPLERRLDRLAGQILRATLAVCGALAALSWLHGDSLGTSFQVGVSLAVAAVPEGLVAVVTVTLALGMRRLAARGAIVRRLRAVETLGSASVICTDKTGTLTTNRMAVARLLPAPGEDEEALLAGAVIASDDVHDPNEAAIADAAAAYGLRRAELLRGGEIVGGEPFDSERKRMSVVVAEPDGRRTAYVKGAPEAIAPLVADPVAAEPFEREAQRWAAEGIRVLMVARRRDPEHGADPELMLDPLGLIGLIDPVREGARESVETARRAGVRTMMITGDHPRTATAVARACGIASGPEPEVVSGAAVDRMSDDELRERIGEIDVLARAVPEHKSRVVEALQERGEVVAMTGDGVNDAPALRAADVGVAIGDGGSDAAKEAADIVLADNDFSTIVAAIEGGRRIYDNIVRFVAYLLAANAGEVIFFSLAVIPGLGAPLTVVQILLVNLLTNGLPAVALGLDPADPGSMRRPPRPRSQTLLGPLRAQLAVGALATAAATFTAFLVGSATDHATGQTMAFTTLLCAQLTYVFGVRGEEPFWRAGRNRVLYGAVALSALAAAAVLTVPPLAEAFDAVALGGGQLAAALLLGLLPLLAAELHKLARRRAAGRSAVTAARGPVAGRPAT